MLKFQKRQKKILEMEKKLNKRISFRVTDKEFDRLESEFIRSPFNKKSDFLRSIFAKHKADENMIKEREAMIAAGQLSDALNKIGVNFNQLIRKINAGVVTSLNKKEKNIINEIGKYVYEAIKILSKTKI